MAAGTEGGWICAGRTLHTCHVLQRGFAPAAWVAGWGGLLAASGYAANGYVQQHYNGVTIQTAGTCNPSGTNRYICPYSSPSVLVAITYRAAKGGWIVAGSAASG